MSNRKIQRQFGLWKSLISPMHLAHGTRFSDVAWGEDGSVIWLESRSGHNVLVIQPADGQALRDLNSTFSVRAGVGYGGGDFSTGKGQVFFVDAASGRLYRQPLSEGLPAPVTPGFGSVAAPTLSPDGAWLLLIRSYEGQDSLEIVDAAGENWPHKLVAGSDFYMQPVWHPDGNHIAWISWDHPNMPWDGTKLCYGKINFSATGCPGLAEIEVVAGGEEISIFQPEFSPDGRYLAYVSDESGWWQLYLYNLDTREYRQITHMSAEHGLPAWVQGMRSYGFSPDGRFVFFIRNRLGLNTLWRVELESGLEVQLPIDPNYTSLEQICVSSFGIALIASGAAVPARILTCSAQYDEAEQGHPVHIQRRAMTEEIPQEAYSNPENIAWKGLDSGEVHGLYFSPHNPRFEAVEKPPLILNIHGGPTSQVGGQFNLKAQFFTSRGYAYLDVNHRGSSGYGRAYRNKLRGNWGIYDVQDAVSGANFLINQGWVDSRRIVIIGGSAGGFTVYKALEDYPEFFRAGICLFGISNQFALTAETHKFEAHYSDSLLGVLPEAAAVYRERSPIYYVDKIQAPMAIFQGEDDRVVPRRQSDEVVEILKRNNIPVIYHVYPGEGHGFRKTETIQHMYQAIEKFLLDYVIYI